MCMGLMSEFYISEEFDAGILASKKRTYTEMFDQPTFSGRLSRTGGASSDRCVILFTF